MELTVHPGEYALLCNVHVKSHTHTTQHNTHNTTQHNTTQHNTTQHNTHTHTHTTQHNTTHTQHNTHTQHTQHNTHNTTHTQHTHTYTHNTTRHNTTHMHIQTYAHVYELCILTHTHMHTQVYITEISPVNKRGFFGSWNQLFVTIGVLTALSLGISHKDLHYFYVSIVAVATATVFMLAMLFVEESPVWLLVHGKLDKGERVLRRLRGPNVDVNKEIDEITGNLIQPEKMSLVKSLLQLRRCPVMVPFLLSLMVMFFQQFGGINALVFYASQQLQNAQVPDYSIVSSFTVGGTQVLFTVVGVLLVERLGRKILLITSSVGMMVSCITLAVDLYLVRPPATTIEAKKYSPLAIASFVVYNAAFSVGWGPLPWVMMSELVPTSVRGLSTGVATAFNWGSVALITFALPYFADAVKPYGEWYTFGGIMFVSIFAVAFLLPETKGRSMDEIQQTFEAFSYPRYLFPKRRGESTSSEDEPLLFASKT